VLDARTGDLLAPVRGELFDLVVSNPPFVVGPAARYTYRDAGWDGDDLCRQLVTELPRHLVEDGTAVLLANWLHVEGEDGDERVQSWFGPEVDGWVVQRELAGPEDYVTAWLRDTDEGSRFDELYDAWMDWFDQRRVEAVAFGHRRAAARRAERVALDDVPQPVARPGASRSARTSPRWTCSRPTCCRPAAAARRRAAALGRRAHRRGLVADAQLLQQERGLRWSAGSTSYGATLLAGCDGTRRLGRAGRCPGGERRAGRRGGRGAGAARRTTSGGAGVPDHFGLVGGADGRCDRRCGSVASGRGAVRSRTPH
jgi:hypothetical protein